MGKLFTSQETTRPDQILYFKEKWEYKAALDEQLLVFDKVASGNLDFQILTGEHKAVYTLGNSLKAPPKSQSNLPFINTDRGGQLMYHGPGQLTIYPIFKLKNYFSGPREYSKYVFDMAIGHFAQRHGVNLKCNRNGLWLDDKKVGFLGLRIKNGICYHGLSLNYGIDLSAFKQHSPCDISGDQAGNIFETFQADGIDLRKEAEALSKAIALKLTK